MPHSASRGRVDDPVVAGARTPRRREHTRHTGAPVVSVSHIPGQGRCYLSVETPRPMLQSARRGWVVVTGQALRPGRGLCAHTGAGGWVWDRAACTGRARRAQAGTGADGGWARGPPLLAAAAKAGLAAHPASGTALL